MIPSFEAHRAADRRLVILTLLSHATGYSDNEYLIHAVLPEQGHDISRDKLHVELAWLTEQGLITANKVGGVTIAKLTARGLDVARGRATAPGVKRPEPL